MSVKINFCTDIVFLKLNFHRFLFSDHSNSDPLSQTWKTLFGNTCVCVVCVYMNYFTVTRAMFSSVYVLAVYRNICSFKGFTES